MKSNFLHREQDFIVAVNELDYMDRLKPSAIAQFFQNLATSHAVDLGIGFEEMKEKNLFWILSRMSVIIEKSPKLGEKIFVSTFPKKPNMVDAVREFYIMDENGDILVRATSKWCVVDVSSRSIRRCQPLFKSYDSEYTTESALENGNPQLPSLDTKILSDKVYNFEVLITDLDRNIHMNNARYGDIIINCCELEKLNEYSVKAFDINFLSELKIGEKFVVRKAEEGNYTYFEATKNLSTIVFRAKIEWVKNGN